MSPGRSRDWAIALAALLTGASFFGWLLIPLLIGAVCGLLAVKSIRDAVLIKPAFGTLKGILPSVSETEQQALDAGTVGWDAELFSGTPDWIKLRAVPPIVLTPEERAFLDGPTEELCRMVDDWQIRHNDREIPDAIWRFVSEKGFLGMLISKAHGGLGFSAQAQSLILGKISSRSPDVATIVMVPNSLGPGELIEKYGTLDQKEHYLPRLAKGDEIPCFGLTGPTSGSDAATMRDIGTVARGIHTGRRRSASASPGRSATSRSAPRRRCWGSLSACSIPKSCSAKARTSASRWRSFRRTIPASTSAGGICHRARRSRTVPTGARTSSFRWTGSSAARTWRATAGAC